MQTHDLQKPYLSIVIPVYNEESRIGDTLKKIDDYITAKDFPVEVLLVLNNCTDGTKDVINSFENKPDMLRVIDMGLLSDIGNTKGAAVVKGALCAQGAYIAFIDADLATPLFELDKLLSYAEFTQQDVVIGSRRVSGASIDISQAWYRTLLGKAGNFLIRLLLLPGIKDTQCGCKLFSYKAVQDFFGKVSIFGWGFDIEVLVLAKKAGYKINEIGVHWHDVAGSKVHAKAYGSTLKELGKIFIKFRLK